MRVESRVRRSLPPGVSPGKQSFAYLRIKFANTHCGLPQSKAGRSRSPVRRSFSLSGESFQQPVCRLLRLLELRHVRRVGHRSPECLSLFASFVMALLCHHFICRANRRAISRHRAFRVAAITRGADSSIRFSLKYGRSCCRTGAGTESAGVRKATACGRPSRTRNAPTSPRASRARVWRALERQAIRTLPPTRTSRTLQPPFTRTAMPPAAKASAAAAADGDAADARSVHHESSCCERDTE